ncbi:hypothetical protein BGZ54_009029 [Gamsiella multidivaricata]|nr:hypothetical protein BGZ54_009029 [Gamsiella multidivaricata]
MGLIFCFRRASKLFPRNLNIQLQMFGQNNNDSQSPGRGPIALSDDDLAGATGIDWEDLEGQLGDEDGNDDNDEEEEMDDMVGGSGGLGEGRPLKPMKRLERYLDGDDDEEQEGQELSDVRVTSSSSRYHDDDDDEEEGAAHLKTPRGSDTQEGGRIQKDALFKLEDADSEQE